MADDFCFFTKLFTPLQQRNGMVKSSDISHASKWTDEQACANTRRHDDHEPT
ncbi:hypothetical protein RND71_041728 [Anisodus tanguticus]|uniref:Uncharacterized protein n=1 Tax=Anisodus tanguticus TaxID=243964 RepID=A0AAE1QVN1_9SOLA|nr:hypothetical protein RND71_041728 [Anisodus tanguticus]